MAANTNVKGLRGVIAMSQTIKLSGNPQNIRVLEENSRRIVLFEMVQKVKRLPRTIKIDSPKKIKYTVYINELVFKKAKFDLESFGMKSIDLYGIPCINDNIPGKPEDTIAVFCTQISYYNNPNITYTGVSCLELAKKHLIKAYRYFIAAIMDRYKIKGEMCK